MTRKSFFDQPIHGLLLLNKPTGISSNKALQRARACYRAQKAGHSGSLDPLATGMLPVFFGEATKFSQYLLDADKTYYVTARLGANTTTGDAEGEITQTRSIPTFNESELKVLLQQFLGAQTQIPPMYSALKHHGQPLYQLARQGKEVERKARQIVIHQLHLDAFSASSISLRVHCSKGTYIRTLVEDIGESLGCGAYVEQLHRENVSHFISSKMVSLTHLETLSKDKQDEDLQALLLPVDYVLSHLPVLKLPSHLASNVTQGQSIQFQDASHQGLVRLYSEKDQFLGLGESIEHKNIVPRRMLNVSELVCFP